MKITIRPFRSVPLFRRFLPLAAAGLLAMPLGAEAAISIGLQHYTSITSEADLPTVDDADLVNTGSPALAFYNTTFPDAFQRTHDGTRVWADILEEPGHFPAFTTFYLNTAANPLGYRIDSIVVLTTSGDPLLMAEAGRVGSGRHHHYQIDYSVVGTDDFETLTTIDISVAEGPGYTRVTLLDLGLDTVGVDVIRMAFTDPLPTSNSVTSITEIDITGAAIPEPGPGLLGLVAGALLLRRRARRRDE